jgi:transcriptional regulator SbtR-like protein/tetracycline repressor-like protein
MSAKTDRSIRADARRNREKLLAAATEAFAASGTDASLEAIAKRAGVGIGTLYRHFPTREALVEAAYRNEVAQLHAAAEELLAAHPPEEALAEWMDRFVGYAAAKRGMKGALQSFAASKSGLFDEARAQILDAITMLLDAGIAAGSIRPDVTADDVLRAMGALWLVNDEEFAAQAPKLLGLLMDGLRYGSRFSNQ